MKISPILRTSLVAAAIAAVAPAAVQANITYSARPKQTPAQAKNFDWVDQAGGLRCEPKGKLKELVSEPNKCYINLDECQASYDTLTGKVDPGIAEVFVDMATTNPGGDKFINTCPGENGPEFVELLAIRGLGYLRDTKNAPLLSAIVAGPRAEKSGRGLRTAVTEAFAYMGSHEAAEPSYKNLLTVKTQDPEYKDTILQMLGRWNSDSGVAFCTDALTNNDEKKNLDACVFYLGQRKAVATIPQLQRIFEKHSLGVLESYALMGDKSVLPDIQSYLDAKDGQPAHTRLPALVAAINLGDSSRLAELQTWLSGQRPQSKKDIERAAKSKSKSKSKAPTAAETFDPEFVEMAAMESELLTDAKAIAAVKKTLQAQAAKKDDKKWKGYVYATIALAHMGDAKAIAAVAEFINGSKEDIRDAAISATGSRDIGFGENWHYAGKAYIADKAIAAALAKYIPLESDKQRKVKATNALGMTNAMLVKN